MATNDEAIYRRENVPLFEAIYGKGLISLGGYAAVDHMFDGVDLNHKHVLDIGFGIGGIAQYLLAKFDVRVSGVEVHPWMVDYATEATPADAKGKVNFLTYTAQGTIPLPPACIDLAYSKGVLTNVADKRRLFHEIARVLRPQGELCLIDWLVPPEGGATTTQLSMGQLSYKETEDSYREMLGSCGFATIVCQDVTQEYLTYVQDLADALSAPEHITRYDDILGSELRKDTVGSHATLRNAIASGAQMSCRIRATLA